MFLGQHGAVVYIAIYFLNIHPMFRIAGHNRTVASQPTTSS